MEEKRELRGEKKKSKSKTRFDSFVLNPKSKREEGGERKGR